MNNTAPPMAEPESGMAQLQSLLLKSIEDLRAGSIQPQQARAINDIGQTLVNSAKAEIELARITKTHRSSFIPNNLPAPRQTANGQGEVTPNGPSHAWPGITHRTKDD